VTDKVAAPSGDGRVAAPSGDGARVYLEFEILLTSSPRTYALAHRGSVRRGGRTTQERV
jgi:hypothetical protein